MTVQYKTPGVFVEELDAFPPSIVGVETAVPVFIGYTEKADRNGRSVLLQPVRIASMVDYAPIFGGALPYQFKFEAVVSAADVTKAEQALKDAQDKQHAAVFELGKSVVRTTIATLEARTGKKVEFQDDEARKSGMGGI